MNLWEIQADASRKHIIDKDKGTGRKQIYYKLVGLYGDLLNTYARNWPQEETDPRMRLAARQYTQSVWMKIMELLMRGLTNEGTIWSDKLIYPGIKTEMFGTKVEAVLGVMGMLMTGGMHGYVEIVRIINYHLWLKQRLNIQNPIN